VQSYSVASGIIVDRGQLLLVQNQRRNGSLDWSTPGGVVDPGEEVLEALQREVIEETALVVDQWLHLAYSVHVEFVGREMTLLAQVFHAAGFQGQLHVDDPDQVVVDGRWANADEVDGLLDSAPQWVAEPLIQEASHSAQFQEVAWRYQVTGTGRNYEVELLQGR